MMNFLTWVQLSDPQMFALSDRVAGSVTNCDVKYETLSLLINLKYTTFVCDQWKHSSFPIIKKVVNIHISKDY